MNIIEFLEARIAEDEAQSRLVTDTNANMNHIANWNPARVLAECAAKRAIIKECERLEEMRIDLNLWNMEYPEDTILRPLASVYMDHPDYQKEWG